MNAENELRSRVDSFVNELSELIRRQALEAVESALKGREGGGGAGAARRGPGRPAKAAPAVEERRQAGRPRGRAAAPAAPTKAAKKRAGEKRTPQELAAITEQVFNHIKNNPGQGVEQIAKALGTATKELTLPIRKLLADKKVTSKGQKRATRYSPK